MRGKIKFVDRKRGTWGFITPEEPSQAGVYFHVSNFTGEQPGSEDAGREVEFELEVTAKGRSAKNIHFSPSQTRLANVSTKKPDKIVVERLVRIKGTFKGAESLLERASPLDGGLSLVLMDAAIEAGLKLSLDGASQKDARVGKDVSFDTILERAGGSPGMDGLQTLKLRISYLHAARNGFQHQGIIPDLALVRDEYRGLTAEVLGVIAKSRFGIDWAAISLGELLSDEKVRALYIESERLEDKGELLRAAATLIFAFELTKNSASSDISGSGINLSRAAAAKDDSGNYLRNYALTLDVEIETFKLGLGYVELRNYLDIAARAGITSILGDVLAKDDDEEIIDDFTESLRENLSTEEIKSLLPIWCRTMRETILSFAMRTERRQRASIQVEYEEWARLLEKFGSKDKKSMEKQTNEPK